METIIIYQIDTHCLHIDHDSQSGKLIKSCSFQAEIILEVVKLWLLLTKPANVCCDLPNIDIQCT